MSRTQRIAASAAAVLILVLGFVLLQPDDDEDDTPTPVATTTAPAVTPSETGTTTTPSRPEPARPKPPPVERITVRGGQPVSGVKKISIRSGRTLRLNVTADAAEEVHIHGYDISGEVGPGRTAKFKFKADAEGVFEIELENSAVPIASLEVRPN